MATLTSVLPSLVAMGVKALRDRIVLAKICNKDFSPVPIPFGSAISVAIPSAITAVEITPAATPPATTAIAPTSVPVTLGSWWEAPFELSDKDLLQCDHGIMPMQASEAIKAMANKIEDTLFAKYASIYGYAGTAGTTPFATDLTAFTAADKVLNDQLCPMEDRHLILNTAARQNALNLSQVASAAYRGDNAAIMRGELGMILGANWQFSTRVPTHTLGAGTAGTINIDSAAGYAVGTKTVHMDGFNVKASAGDVFTIAGDTQTYTVVSATNLAGTDSDVTFEPGLKVAIPAVDGSELVTWKASHVANLLVHRDCVAFASAPMQDSNIAPNLVAMETIVDPESGLALRLELTREHKRWRYSYDCLWGSAVPRPELGCRLAG